MIDHDSLAIIFLTSFFGCFLAMEFRDSLYFIANSVIDGFRRGRTPNDQP